MAARVPAPKVDVEHIQYLTNLFQEVRTEGYMHDYDGDFKIVGMALKRAKEYNMIQLSQLLEYFRDHGLKEVQSMQGWLIWAFKNPVTAMQPYNTIDLQKNGGNINAKREASKTTGREYYDNLFESVNQPN